MEKSFRAILTLKKARHKTPIATNRPTKNSNLYFFIMIKGVAKRPFGFAVDELVNHGVLRSPDRFRSFHSDDFALVEHRDFLDDSKICGISWDTRIPVILSRL